MLETFSLYHAIFYREFLKQIYWIALFSKSPWNTHIKIEMRDKLGVWQDEEWGQEPDDGEHYLHVDLGPGVGGVAGVVPGPGDDHPPPLQTDGQQGEHDYVTGQVLAHHHHYY